MTVELNPFTRDAGTYVAIGSAFTVTLGKMLDGGRGVAEEATVLPYVRAGNIQDSGLDLSDVNSMPFTPTEASNLDLRAGDVLVVEGGAVGTSVVLGDDMPGWSFQKTVNRLRPVGDWESRYVSYVLRAYRDAGVIDIVCNKSTIPHLTAEKLRALRVPAWEPSRQRAIADYLDHETAQIDTLIAEQERLIDLLRERREAVGAQFFADSSGKRTTTVRRVLRPLARPAVAGLGVITAYRDGTVTLRSNRRDDGYTFSDTEHGYQEIRPGDLVFHALDGFAGAIGISDSHGNATPVYHVCEVTDGDDPAYVAMLLRYLGVTGFLATQAPNVRERSVDFRNWSMLARIPLSLPSPVEQTQAVAEIVSQTAKIDTLTAEAERVIELVRERRSALITAAVTGQIDVRSAAA